MKRFSSIFVIVGILFICSCATTRVTATRLIPAHADAPEIRSIVIAGFIGYSEEEERVGEALEEEVNRRIEENSFLTLLKKPDIGISKKRFKFLSWKDLWKQFGQKAGADAVLGGALDVASEDALALTLHIIDSQEGKLLGGKRVIQRGARGLIERTAEQIVETVSPRIVSEQLELLRGRWSTSGIKLAKQGEWGAAIAAWKQELKNHPDAHYLYYNIGIAHRFLGSHELAREHFQKAFELKPLKRYRLASE